MDYTAQTTLPRGIRNNNPGNLRSDVQWAFMTGDDGSGFAVFDDSVHGLRALAKDLTTKINKDGLNTITAIISKYAPPSENVTSAYIQSVVDDAGYPADAQLSADDQTLSRLMRAIVNHENGEGPSFDYVSDADIAQGISMIGLSPAETFLPR